MTEDKAQAEIQAIFNDYVFGFIRIDLEREIWLAQNAESDAEAGRPYPGAGNVLCALGLVCYTEFLGSFITGKANDPMKNFEAFLGEMGECYRDAIKEDGHKVCEFYRNGLVHEYAVKKGCQVVDAT